MKKIIAIILGLAILLCAAAATAENTDKITIGTVSINGTFKLQCGLPEGYTPVPGTITPEQVTAVIRSEDPNAPVMQLSVAYDEMYSDVERMNDLGQEDLEILEQTFIDNDPDVDISYGETGYGTLLLIARHEGENLDYITFFSIYKGYCVEFALVPSQYAEDKNLTEDQLRISVDFLTDLDFIPANVPSGNAKMVAGDQFVTRLTDYNAEKNTVQAEVLTEIILDREDVDQLKVGDTLTIGDDSITVETLERDEYGVLINDETELRYGGGTDVFAYFYEKMYRKPYASLTLQIPDNLVFLDGIDPSSGEILDTPTEHTAAEFREMLAAGGVPDFASDNVYVTFDDDGEMILVERFYTPWQ